MKIKVGVIDKKIVKPFDTFLMKFHKYIRKQKLRPNFEAGVPISIFMKDSEGHFIVDILRNYSGEVWVTNAQRRDSDARKLIYLGKIFYGKMTEAFRNYTENEKRFKSIELEDFQS